MIMLHGGNINNTIGYSGNKPIPIYLNSFVMDLIIDSFVNGLLGKGEIGKEYVVDNH